MIQSMRMLIEQSNLFQNFPLSQLLRRCSHSLGALMKFTRCSCNSLKRADSTASHKATVQALGVLLLSTSLIYLRSNLISPVLMIVNTILTGPQFSNQPTSFQVIDGSNFVVSVLRIYTASTSQRSSSTSLVVQRHIFMRHQKPKLKKIIYHYKLARSIL